MDDYLWARDIGSAVAKSLKTEGAIEDLQTAARHERLAKELWNSLATKLARAVEAYNETAPENRKVVCNPRPANGMVHIHMQRCVANQLLISLSGEKIVCEERMEEPARSEANYSLEYDDNDGLRIGKSRIPESDVVYLLLEDFLRQS